MSQRKGRPTDIRSDGDYYVADFCKRCQSLFYSHAMQNTPAEDIGQAYRLCPWCKGQCSAAHQDHRNEFIESQYETR